MVTSPLDDESAEATANWWIPPPDVDSSSLVIAALAVEDCDSAAVSAHASDGADDNYIDMLWETYDLSMSDAANEEM